MTLEQIKLTVVQVQIVPGIKLGTKKAEVGVDPDALTEFLKNEGIVDQLKDSESGDDDTTKITK